MALVHCLWPLICLQANDCVHDAHPHVVRLEILFDQVSCRMQGRVEIGLMAVSLHQFAGGPPYLWFRKQYLGVQSK